MQTPPPQPDSRTRLEKQLVSYSSNVWGPVVFGILGFILAVSLLLGWPFRIGNRFHEIRIEFKDAELTGLGLADQSLEQFVLLKEKELPANPKGAQVSIDSAKKLRRSIALEKERIKYLDKDSSWYKGGGLLITYDKLKEAIKAFHRKDTMIALGYLNSGYSPEVFPVTTVFKEKGHETSFDFFRKYPGFAFWVFIGILQMVMWMLVVLICFYLLNRIRDLHKLAGTTNRRGKSFGIAAASVAVFCGFLYFGIIDEYLVKDKDFMDCFGVSLTIYAIIGYIVALLCFGGYLYLADTLQLLQTAYKKGEDELKDIIDAKTLEAATPEMKEAVMNLPEVKQKQAMNEVIITCYKHAKRYFNIFLGLSALVLSVMVLWIASMFHSINSMEIFAFYEHVSGRNYLTGDFVYLYGGLHSIILVIFVLPARFKMMDIQITVPALQQAEGEGGNKGVGTAMKNIWKVIGDALIVASPLLASFLQNIIDSLFS